MSIAALHFGYWWQTREWQIFTYVPTAEWDNLGSPSSTVGSGSALQEPESPAHSWSEDDLQSLPSTSSSHPFAHRSPLPSLGDGRDDNQPTSVLGYPPRAPNNSSSQSSPSLPVNPSLLFSFPRSYLPSLLVSSPLVPPPAKSHIVNSPAAHLGQHLPTASARARPHTPQSKFSTAVGTCKLQF